jgi:hypothetical protein
MQAGRAIAPALVAALLASGCGGGGDGRSDKQKVEDAVTSYYRAFGKGDSSAACGYLAKDTAKELEKAAGGQDCPKVLDAALKRPDYARIAKQLAAVKVTSVKVAGKQATATTEVPAVTGSGGDPVSTTVPLKKEGADWKIASAVGEG